MSPVVPAKGGARLLLGVLAAVLAVALAGQLVLRWQDRVADEAGRDGTDAAAVAVERLLTYDAADLAGASGEIGTLTAGPFRDEFTRLFDTLVAPAAAEQQAVSTATIVGRSVVRAGADEVVALLFVNQVTTSTALGGDRIDAVRARVTVQREDGRWVVTALEQV